MPRAKRIGLGLGVALVAAAGLVLLRDHDRSAPDESAKRRPPPAAVSWRPGAPAPARAAANVVWLEGERARASNYSADNPFAPAHADAADALSGGAWLGAAGGARFAEYELAIAEPGDYQLYARKLGEKHPFRFRLGTGDFHEVVADHVFQESVVLQGDVVAAWVYLGKFRLEAGTHVLRLEQAEGPSAWDAFALTRGLFVPRGRFRPGETAGAAPPGWFAFEPELDPFAPAELDLRSLNENVAGEQGFILARGSTFVHAGNGRPVRFWGINVQHWLLEQPDEALAYFARNLAKRGVNLARVHGSIWDPGALEKLDAPLISRLHVALAELKKNGIYTKLSIYFPRWLKPESRLGFEGYDGERFAFALLYFNPRLQAIYRGWWRELLTAENPHTGLALKDDPSIFALELVNEDSTLFWTFKPYSVIPAEQMEPIERRFGDWLARRHGSVARALSAWGGSPVRGDVPAEGRAGFLSIPQLIETRSLRARETTEFLARTLREFHEGEYAFLKRELGFRGSITCSNWTTADQRLFGALDKWANQVCDFMDHHGYFGGKHEGPKAHYTLREGDHYEDASALLLGHDRRHPAPGLPIVDPTYGGKPSMISELGWTFPNRFRTELPLLAAAYGALQGTDAFGFFVAREPAFAAVLGKFTSMDPAMLGQFPAAALMHRQGYVSESMPVVREQLSLDALLALEGSKLVVPDSLDGLRELDLPSRLRSALSRDELVDPLSFLAGKVESSLGPTSELWFHENLDALIDRDARVVTSANGELRWDFGKGLVSVNAPRAQGATGFFRRHGPIALGDVELALDVEYGAALLVSLDGLPLQSSRRMLLQVMTEVTNSGFRADGAGYRRIASVGRPPLVVRSIAGHVAFRRGDAAELRAIALDANGYARAETVGLAAGLVLLPDVFYYVITRS